MSFYEIAEKIDGLLNENVTSETADKLLALIKEDISYQNYFFKKVKDVGWFLPLKKAGYFAPDKNPRPAPSEQEGYLTIPEWNVLPYLEKVSQQLNTPEIEKYIDELLIIIEEVSNYKDSNGQYVDNYRTWWYFVKILVNISKEKIAIDIIELIPIWLESKFETDLQGSDIVIKLLPKFLGDSSTPEDIKKAEKIVESVTAIKLCPLNEERAKLLGKKEETRLIIESYWLQEAFGKYSEIIGNKCTAHVIEDLAKKIKRLLGQKDEGTYESFYEESEYPIDEPLEMLTFILKRILRAKAKSDVNTTKNILKVFCEDEYFYFLKMAIYIIGENIDNYSDLFWEILDTEVSYNLFGNALYFGDELKYLLKNLKNLSENQSSKLNEKIEQSINRYTTEKDQKKYIPLYKQRIYHALSHEAYFKKLYEEMRKITHEDTELHPAIGKVEMRSGEGPSPVRKEEILGMSNKELAMFLSTFEAKAFMEGPTLGGLSNTLKAAAQEQPKKFIDDLSPFLDVGYLYIYDILSGIRDAFNGKRGIEWGNVFKFIELCIEKKEFWEDKFVVKKGDFHGEANHLWVIGVIGELVQDGSKDDAWSFEEKHIKIANKIILFILGKFKKDEEMDINDYVFHLINSPLGKSLIAFIYLALRIARINDKKGVKKDPRWSDEYIIKFDELLNQRIIEAYTSFGLFLPNLSYLDQKWIKDKIGKLTSDRGNKYWVAFIEGYLSVGRVYDNLYGPMKLHYQYGLTYEFKERRNRNRLVQHVCIGYLRNHEKIDDPHSLFRKIIDAWNPDQIKAVIEFFWIQRKDAAERSKQNEEIKERIIEFWRQLYERYKGKNEDRLSLEDKQILSSAAKLAVFLPQIDAESFEWLILSASYVQEYFTSPFFIKSLDELKDKGVRQETSKYIGEIYLKMLEKITPRFDQTHIRSIIEFLYNAAAQENANKICNIYGTRGDEFLRDIYERFAG